MAKLQLHFLGSGSTGNATLVGYDGFYLLLDCGFSGKEIGRRLALVGKDLQEVRSLLLTHEHSDHIAGFPALARNRELTAFAPAATKKRLGRKHAAAERVQPVLPHKSFQVGPFAVTPFATSHDARESVGYVLTVADGTKLGMVSDLGCTDQDTVKALSGCHFLGLESNHDLDLLQHGPYPWFLKKRIRSKLGHLSNQQAAQLLGEVADGRLRHLFALHLSKTNNRPQLAQRELEQQLQKMQLPVPVAVVAPDKPTSYPPFGQLTLF